MTDEMNRKPIFKLLAIMSRLRAPDGCPWDRIQTPESLRPYLLEESHEVLEAIDSSRPDDIRDELGDLLLQIVFIAEIFRESGAFDFDSVCEAISEKLIRRHPHVFGSSEEKDLERLDRQWESIKRAEAETGSTSITAGLPAGLPALLQAQKISSRAARVGFDWDSHVAVLDKLEEEIAELKEAIERENRNDIAAEIGDILFTVVNLGRHLDVDCETGLLEMIRRFGSRFELMKKMISENGQEVQAMDIEQLESYWQRAKQQRRE